MPPTKILETLYIGDMDDGAVWVGPKICVLRRGCPHPECLKMPYVFSLPLEPGEEHGRLVASTKGLRKITATYQKLREHGPVLIHCGHGIERSPLAVVYILVETAGMTVEHAYEVVMTLRPQVQDRRSWMPTKWLMSSFKYQGHPLDSEEG